MSVPRISKATGLPATNLYRHKKDHMHGSPPQVSRSEALATAPTIEALQERDRELELVFKMAMSRGHTAAAVAAANQRIRVILEISNIRGEVPDKPKMVAHVKVDQATAERMLSSFLKHKQLTGGSNGE
jgi:hypothetical protein